ncbi:3-ketoacyl-ACP reductase [Litchfieldella xinjiangensis]|uniref:3-ketoacyl-ACP reductase n=1 Tax=Litchfieldella xinjiangensis TaxID=1166948 RepID=UPI0005BC640E|nr:3-ketoacyl-ACP reductase [Halomonas xinjiangensis]
MNNPQKLTALVTGAARGIGRGCAEALASQGFNLIVNDLAMSEDLEKTIAAVEAHGQKAIPVTGDIADVALHKEIVDKAWDGFGGINCLINNAGISVPQRDDLLKVTPESFDKLINVNLRGTFFLTQEVAKRMLDMHDQQYNSIITVSSANSHAASPDRGEYCISKSGLSMMTKLFAIRLAEQGIKVYEVRPGVIRTNMTGVAKERYDRLFSQGFTPINRWGEASEVGKVIATLASNSLPYTTGETIHVDGGLHIPRF